MSDDQTNLAPGAPAATESPTAAVPGGPAPDGPGRPARPARKVREGVVVSAKMDKTVVVAVIERVRHAKYGKFVQRTKKLYAHDEAGAANAGDRVRLMETRPLSKLKRWRVTDVVERAR